MLHGLREPGACFHFLTIVNNAAVNICVTYMLPFLLYMYPEVEFKLYGNFVWNSVEQPDSVHTGFIPPATCKSSNLATSLSTPVIDCVLILPVVVGTKWDLTVVSMCILLMINDVGHLGMCGCVSHTHSTPRYPPSVAWLGPWDTGVTQTDTVLPNRALVQRGADM